MSSDLRKLDARFAEVVLDRKTRYEGAVLVFADAGPGIHEVPCYHISLDAAWPGVAALPYPCNVKIEKIGDKYFLRLFPATCSSRHYDTEAAHPAEALMLALIAAAIRADS